MKLFIHIGHSKVASSTIQGFLNHNFNTLAEKGCAVVDGRLDFEKDNPVGGFPVVPLNQKVNEENLRLIEAKLTQLHDKLVKNQYQSAVISAENLCNPGKEKYFIAIRDLFEIKIIYYVRPQHHWMASAWKQWGVKTGDTLDQFIEGCLNRRHPGYLNCLHRWQKISSDIHVKSLDDLKFTQNGVCKDFAAAIMMDGTLYFPEKVQNTSFDIGLLEVFRRNEYMFEDRHDNRVYRSVEQLLKNEKVVKPTTLLTDSNIRRIRKKLTLENAQLETEFGLSLDKHIQPETGKETQRPTGEVAMLYRACGQMVEMIVALQHEVSELRKKIKTNEN